MPSHRIPLATYRVQLHTGFGFEQARAIVGYLDKLGISDLYLSPIFQAQHGSTHGYDVADHTIINRELGGESEFIGLSTSLQEHGMSTVLDVVPNHMGIVDEMNRWWQDVLENGPSSPYASFFDIDWYPPTPELQNRVLLPVLGDQYGTVLERQELCLQYNDGTFLVQYYDKHFPIDPRTWEAILEPVAEVVRPQLARNDEHLIELESILTAVSHLPFRTETNPDKVEERQREKEVVKKRLSRLVEASGTVREAVQIVVEQMNGRKDDPRSFDALEGLLADQVYRLSFWRVAADEINYRRFFDVNELAAIRVEQPAVFRAVHGLVFHLIADGHVQGLRIDHPDGLFDPKQYFLDLQKGCHLALAGQSPVTSQFPAHTRETACWVVVEKILGYDERLPEEWAVSGNTGYDFMNEVNGIWVDSAGARAIGRIYSRFTDMPTNFTLLVYQCKKLVLDVLMSSELTVLARRLDRISEQRRGSRDFTLWSLHDALGEIIACFPVYRTYIRAANDEVSDEDRHHIHTAVRAAKRRNRSISPSIFDFIASVLLLEHPKEANQQLRDLVRDFVMRFQQITSPVMAKGVEDTAFYRVYPLASLNEVGGSPEHFGMSLEEFHRRNIERLEAWPHSLLATSTHDTKRSEDVRTRIDVLSEIPGEWAQALRRWRLLNRKKKLQVDGIHVPDSNEEYLFYQTLLGVWPLDSSLVDGLSERLKGYMVKAAREAKIHTSWISPNEAHEEALQHFVELVLDPTVSSRFLEDFEKVLSRIRVFGALYSLSQVLLKMTCPGVPDFYQGSELWEFCLVDPDNRRPVGYERRMRLLDELCARKDRLQLCRELVENWQDGRIKLYTTWRALSLRKQLRSLFENGEYLPLAVDGLRTDHVCAFARQKDEQWVLVMVPRLTANVQSNGQLTPVRHHIWAGTRVVLPDGSPQSWVNEFSGEVCQVTPGTNGSRPGLDLQCVFEAFPVALFSVLRQEEGAL